MSLRHLYLQEGEPNKNKEGKAECHWLHCVPHTFTFGAQFQDLRWGLYLEMGLYKEVIKVI